MWSVWWVWIVAGFAFGGLEMIAPAFVFLGFAGGALVTGLLLAFALVAGDSLPLLLMIFALASLVIWGAVRLIIGTKPGQVKVWHRDVND